MVLESSFIVRQIFLIMEVSFLWLLFDSTYMYFVFSFLDNKWIWDRISLLVIAINGYSPLCSLKYAGNKAVGVMKAGQTFTIEPMINAGILSDNSYAAFSRIIFSFTE